jgi:thioredoxin-related protein
MRKEEMRKEEEEERKKEKERKQTHTANSTPRMRLTKGEGRKMQQCPANSKNHVPAERLIVRILS